MNERTVWCATAFNNDMQSKHLYQKWNDNVFISVSDRLVFYLYFVKNFVQNRWFIHRNCRDHISHLQRYWVRCTFEMYLKEYWHVCPMLLNALSTILVQLDQKPLIHALIATVALDHFESWNSKRGRNKCRKQTQIDPYNLAIKESYLKSVFKVDDRITQHCDIESKFNSSS